MEPSTVLNSYYYATPEGLVQGCQYPLEVSSSSHPVHLDLDTSIIEYPLRLPVHQELVTNRSQETQDIESGSDGSSVTGSGSDTVMDEAEQTKGDVVRGKGAKRSSESVSDNPKKKSKRSNRRAIHYDSNEYTSFLNATYSLNKDQSKFVSAGLFKTLDCKPGVFLFRQGCQRFLLMDYYTFGKFILVIEHVTQAVRNHSPRKFGFGNSSLLIKTVNVSTKTNVEEEAKPIKTNVEIEFPHLNQSILLSELEWNMLVLHVPTIKRWLEHLASKNSWMVEHIKLVMNTDKVYIPPPQQLDGYEGDRLHDEVVVYKNMQQLID